jgi:hypothetical protein
MSDAFGGDSPVALRKYVEAVLAGGSPGSELAVMLERGKSIAAREGDSSTANWLAGKLSESKGMKRMPGSAGAIYAAYLNPEDVLVANDPLLLRKHQAFEVRPGQLYKNGFSRLN